MQRSYDYKDYNIRWCCRSERSGWHIFIEIPGGEAIHVGPDDLTSFEEAKLHIDAQEAAGLDKLLIDLERLFGEYRPV